METLTISLTVKSLKLFNEKYLNFAYWGDVLTESKIQQNFTLGQFNVNTVRLFDKGILEGEELYRFYFIYDVYSSLDNIIVENYKDCLANINKVTFDLFKDTLSEEGKKYLKDENKV